MQQKKNWKALVVLRKVLTCVIYSIAVHVLLRFPSFLILSSFPRSVDDRGIATMSLLHSFIPTHWLPFSIVGRAQKWTLSPTLLVTAFGAILHDYDTIRPMNQAVLRTDFCNRTAVPLYLELIKSRLKRNYYRSLEAVKHYIEVMFSNARAYFVRRDLAAKIVKFAKCIQQLCKGGCWKSCNCSNFRGILNAIGVQQ